jgi:hypothetical protein
MSRKVASAATAVMWLLAAAVALAAARYFLNPVPLLVRTQSLALARHPVWLLLHIACGVAALVAGPFQFVASLRASHPAVHRATGYVYLAAVLLGGCAGLRLSADTAQFVADGLNDNTAFELIGMAPTVLGFAPNTTYDPSQFFLVVLAFAALSITWIVTSAAALVRARQRRFADHRAWMMRSYSLTFAAVTVRLMAVPLLFVTQDPVVAITLTFWSWVLNLMIAEWLARRAVRAAALRTLIGLPDSSRVAPQTQRRETRWRPR